MQAADAANDLLDDLPGSDAFAELVRLAVAKDPSLADAPAPQGAAAHSPPMPTDAKKPPWLRQRAPQGVSTSCDPQLPAHECIVKYRDLQ